MLKIGCNAVSGVSRDALGLILFCWVMSGSVQGQIISYPVSLQDTDPGYASTEPDHEILFNEALQEGRLFLFFGGTGSPPNSYLGLRNFAAQSGFHCISLSYPNEVAAASLANDPDPLAFDRFRQEIAFGTPISPAVEVDSLNSLYTRTLRLLQYLAANRTSENWNHFLLTEDQIDWSKVILAGHSQGSGHAAFLAQRYTVERVLMFAGPNDYSAYFNQPGNWLGQMSATSIQRHYAYLSLLDEVVPFGFQYANLDRMGLTMYDTVWVDNLSDPFEESHFLFTQQTPGIALLNHNSPIVNSPINNEVWDYMLKSPVVSGIPPESDTQNGWNLWPNPARDRFNLSGIAGQNHAVKWRLVNAQGVPVVSGIHGRNETLTVELSNLSPGMYWLLIEGQQLPLVVE